LYHEFEENRKKHGILKCLKIVDFYDTEKIEIVFFLQNRHFG